MKPNQKIQEAKQRHIPPPPERRKCCATCDHLALSGYCRAFDAWPPLDFVEQENDCNEYEEDPPF